MKILVRAVFQLALCFFCQTICIADVHNNKSDLHDLLPRLGEVNSWFTDGAARFAEGKDLYLLIDGGAEIYYEYGFNQVVFQTYSNANGQSINLEIYEMKNPEAAYGIYTFKTGMEGVSLEIGQEGWLESYFLNFWKGNFLITVIGLSDDPVTLSGIKEIARTVNSKLDVESTYPLLIFYLSRENLAPDGFTYLKGNLALFNYYLFDTADIFGLQEGVIGKYPDYSIFVFQYNNKAESEKWYVNAKNHLKESIRFTNYTEHDSWFELYDTRSKLLTIKRHQNWILIVLAAGKMDADWIFNSLQSKLNLKN